MNIEKLKTKTRNIVNLFIRLKYALITSEGLAAKCFCCGKIWLLDSTEAKRYNHCSHLFREDLFESVRYYHNNLRPACRNCNKNLHGNTAIFTEKLIAEIGLNEYEKLCFLKNQIKKWNALELEQIIKEHEELLSSPEMQKKIKLYKG